MPAKIEQRIQKLESAMLPSPPESGCGMVDFDSIKQKIESKRLLAEHTDPFVRLKHCREEIHKAEQTVAAGTKCKTDLGPALAKISLPIDHHRVRDAELEILERAGFDTGELRAKHRQHAANPYKWPYRDNTLPSEAQTILDRIFYERN